MTAQTARSFSHIKLDTVTPGYPYTIPEGVVLSDSQYEVAKKKIQELEYLRAEISLTDSIINNMQATVLEFKTLVESKNRIIINKDFQISSYKINQIQSKEALDRQRLLNDELQLRLNKVLKNTKTRDTIFYTTAAIIIVGLLVGVILK